MRHDVDNGQRWFEAYQSILDKKNYWEKRCLLAEKCLETSPCDPDITEEQIKAHSEYNEFLNKDQKP